MTMLTSNEVYRFLCNSFFPAYYDWIYALMPSKRRFIKQCEIVHEFAMDIIQKRRTELNEAKIHYNYIYYIYLIFIAQGEWSRKTKKEV